MAAQDIRTGLWLNDQTLAFDSCDEIRIPVDTQAQLSMVFPIVGHLMADPAYLICTAHESYADAKRRVEDERRGAKYGFFRRALYIMASRIPMAKWAVRKNLDELGWDYVVQVRPQYAHPAFRHQCLHMTVPRPVTEDYLLFDDQDDVGILRLAGIPLIDISVFLNECSDEWSSNPTIPPLNFETLTDGMQAMIDAI